MPPLVREMSPAAGAQAPAAAPAVRVQALEHSYGDRPALRGVGFEVARGEIFGMLGPNGGGKTTLFRILSTLVPLQRGQAEVLGTDLRTGRTAIRRQLGVVFQAPALDRKLTVAENLRHQGHLYGLRGAELGRRIDAGLERFRIADRRDERVESLSGGLRRRVEIAKGLLHRPQLLLLDEPSTGLDPGARRDLGLLLQEIRAADGVTVLLTSHILDEVERCDRVLVLDRGQVVALGSPDELRASVGGDVITITTADPRALVAAIAERRGLQAAVVDGAVRIEGQASPALVRALLEDFPEAIAAVTFAKPTLEDVFIHATGHRFWAGDEPAAGGEGA